MLRLLQRVGSLTWKVEMGRLPAYSGQGSDRRLNATVARLSATVASLARTPDVHLAAKSSRLAPTVEQLRESAYRLTHGQQRITFRVAGSAGTADGAAQRGLRG